MVWTGYLKDPRPKLWVRVRSSLERERGRLAQGLTRLLTVLVMDLYSSAAASTMKGYELDM